MYLLVIPALVLCSLDCNKQEPYPPQVSSQQPLQKAQTFKILRKFSGRGDLHTKALHISGNTVKLAGRTWGSLEDIYTTMELKSASGLQITGNMLTIHTDGLQNGRGEITISNVAPGDYYVSVMTNMNWEVTIYEGM